MFTGLIEEIGQITNIERIAGGKRLKLVSKRLAERLKISDSLAINGTCLTVTHIEQQTICFDVVGETLKKTTLNELNIGSYVNLERALRLSDRLGGHLVQGHVNGIGQITALEKRGENYFLQILIPQNLQKYIVQEGSIAIDGISLTVSQKSDSFIAISIIPHSWQNTTLKYARVGQKVNLEVDILAKYIENFLENFRQNEKFSSQWFEKLGY